jgi:oligopeptide/dipeptide ABC transporter ATP-binding protein
MSGVEVAPDAPQVGQSPDVNNGAGTSLLEVKNLSTTFNTQRGDLCAVADVSFHLGRDETLGIVGESGSGKTVLTRTIMGLQPRRNVTVEGSVLLNGFEVINAPEGALRKIWGRDVAMIFQDPMTSLNPVVKVGKQIAECLHVRLGQSSREAKKNAIELLRLVGIPSPVERYSVYPTQLSGGMRQRIVIAIALACNPQLLLADEPTTGLDVTIQAQILALLEQLKTERQMSVILVTHDLGVVAHNTDRIIVMYAGRIVETGFTRDLFYKYRMPYTEALLSSTPSITSPSHTRLTAIPGRPPDLLRLPPGCAFASRCSYATDQCRKERPELRQSAEPGHFFACWNPIPLRARPIPPVMPDAHASPSAPEGIPNV